MQNQRHLNLKLNQNQDRIGALVKKADLQYLFGLLDKAEYEIEEEAEEGYEGQNKRKHHQQEKELCVLGQRY